MTDLLDILKARLIELDAALPKERTLEMILEEECESLLNKNKDDGKKLCISVSDYIDDAEEKTHNVCQNVGKFTMKIAKKMDEMRLALRKMTHAYEVKKRGCYYDSDDAIDELNTKFNSTKDGLRKSKHHIELETNLKDCFGVLDLLE